MSEFRIGEPFVVTLNGQEYRIEWLGPDHLSEDPPPAILGGPLRPSKEGDYGQHIETLYNMQEDIPRGDLDPEDFRSDSGDVRWGDYWGAIGSNLQGKVEWFSFVAFDGDMPAGKLRFFPKDADEASMGRGGTRKSISESGPTTYCGSALPSSTRWASRTASIPNWSGASSNTPA